MSTFRFDAQRRPTNSSNLSTRRGCRAVVVPNMLARGHDAGVCHAPCLGGDSLREARVLSPLQREDVQPVRDPARGDGQEFS